MSIEQAIADIRAGKFVVVADDYEASIALDQELKEMVKGRLAPYKYPRWIEFVPDLPKNDRGKIDRKALKQTND